MAGRPARGLVVRDPVHQEPDGGKARQGGKGRSDVLEETPEPIAAPETHLDGVAGAQQRIRPAVAPPEVILEIQFLHDPPFPVLPHETDSLHVGELRHASGEKKGADEVLTRSDELAAVVRSLRDWGRDCVCPPGRDDTCGRRFSGRFGTLPEGYDHKYVYSRLGFNLKATDLQAAVGLAQIDRLDAFTAARRRNFDFLKGALADLTDELLLPEPTPGSEPSWFGFPLTLKAGRAPKRPAVIKALEARRIATRMLLAGNMTRQPAFEGVGFRVAGSLKNTDRITRDAFWVGVYPGITEEMCAYVAESIREAVEGTAEKAH